jgi:VanZ family protein
MHSPLAKFPRLLFPAIAVVYLLAIFAATHVPRKFQAGAGGRDKIFHFVAFAVLAAIATLWVMRYRQLTWTWVAIILGVLAAYAAFDEITQQVFSPPRKAEFNDWLADMCGAVAGMAGVWGWERWRVGRAKGVNARR